MLQSAVLTVGRRYLRCLACIDQAKPAEFFQQGNITDIGRECRVFMGMCEDQVLHHEFDIDDTASIMLQIELAAFIRVAAEHFLAHGDNFMA